jgi:uncharacterized protein YuzE
MQLKYDLNVGALYIRLTDRAVARTHEIDDNTFVDLDAAGGVVGIEVISIVHPWALNHILRDYSLPASEVAQLHAYFRPTTQGTVQKPPALNIEHQAPICVAA